MSSCKGQSQALSKKYSLPKSLWGFEGIGKTAHWILTLRSRIIWLLNKHGQGPSLKTHKKGMRTPFGAALALPRGPRAGLPHPQCPSMQQQLHWECWEGPPQDILSRRCLMLAALMDSVISRGPLSADRQSGRRWQVKNTLLAKRLRWGPRHGNCSDARPLGQEVRNPRCWTFGWPDPSFASSLNWPQR